MCRNSVVNVVEIEKESISTTVTTCLRPYRNQALRLISKDINRAEHECIYLGTALPAGLFQCFHPADNRMRSHRLLRPDDNRSVASCQQT